MCPCPFTLIQGIPLFFFAQNYFWIGNQSSFCLPFPFPLPFPLFQIPVGNDEEVGLEEPGCWGQTLGFRTTTKRA